jgi:hypothetical protein
MNYRILLVVVLFIFCLGCKDNDQNVLLYKTGGFIKGKVQGALNENSYFFDDDFIYRQYNNETESRYSKVGGSTYRAYIQRRIVNSGVYVTLGFNFTADDSNTDFAAIEVLYRKESGSKIYQFYSYANPESQNTISITDFSFDQATGRVRGKFSHLSTFNVPGHEVTVEGEFDVVLIEKIQ